jgi:carbon-monoxide dehydrogenase small subunit
MPITVTARVNGKPVKADVEARTLLTELLRDHLRLTGTHVGCDTSQCGACIVHLDGRAVKDCTVLAVQVEGADIVTIEGIASADGELHPMQAAFKQHHALQCGFCTPGMIMMALDIVKWRPEPSEDEIRAGLAGNFCRCTGYQNIVNAVKAGAQAMRAR